MHPFITSDKPGDCPICNMRLVLTKPEATAPQAGAVEGRGRVAIPVDLQRRIGLRTAAVAREPFARTIRAAARVEVDERGLSAVSLRYAGWIEELFVRATGEAVRAGEPLLSVYSPELYEAQRSYLFARGAMGAEDDAVSTLRERLLCGT
jgi:Cu(I)/Ag(I) efflux system membrane fusion protein